MKAAYSCIVLLSMVHTLAPVTLVYNLKIRRSFALHKFLNVDKKLLWVFSTVPVFYRRTRHVVAPALQRNVQTRDLLGGAIFNLRCLAPHNWWAELTTGVERQTTKVRGTQNLNVARTGMDDIVLTAGKNFLFGHEQTTQLSLYGLAGFPTRRKVCPDEAFDTLVGTRFFGAGFGAEISHSFISSMKRSLNTILQTRFVHFFNRSWPLLPCNAKIEPGNITDLFIILQYREKKNIFETGYNPTFFTQQGIQRPTGNEASPNFVRNSFYTSYTRIFPQGLLLKHPGSIGVGINIGRVNIFDTKIANMWVNFSLLF